MSDIFSDISVVVPAYNPGSKLLDCLSSLSEMDYPREKIEVVVVDDCSSEDVTGLVRVHFPEFHVIRRNENGGCDAARDDGIRFSSGRIIANTDADCCVSRDWARRINKHLQAESASITGPVIHEMGLRAQFVAITQFGHSQSKRAGTTHTFPGCNFAILRDVLNEYGYRRDGTRDGADRVLAWSLYKAGYRLAYDPEMIVFHHPPVACKPLWRRCTYYSGVTYRIRKLYPDLPGGTLVRYGPLAPGLLSAWRLGRDYQRLLFLAMQGRMRLYLLPLLASAFPLMRTVDALVMLRTYLQTTGEETDKVA